MDSTKIGEASSTYSLDAEWQLFWEKMCLPSKIAIEMPNRPKKVIVLAGPTGSGKTALSLVLARALGGEIISADSMQVYQGMDIGTAKIAPEEREGIAHHLIDIRSLDQSFNVADFCKEAQAAIEQIYARDHVPIVVGGTGFYLHALLYGAPQGPPSRPATRCHWEQKLEEEGALTLFAKLQEIDPKYAQTITVSDKHKIVRALEIISLTGQKVSDFVWEATLSSTYNFRCWFMHFSKETTYQRIEERCEEMIAKGLLAEVESLDRLGLANNSSASRAIGYRQCLKFLESPRSIDDWQQCVAQFKQASRRYAKRQFTWFRKEPAFRWLNREEISFEKAAEIILQDFELSL